eukprot:gene5515-5923_t
MATIGRLSRNQSQMSIGSPNEVEEHHHPKTVKVENLNHTTLIKPDELAALIKKLTLDDNEEIIRRLDEAKTPFLFTSDDLAKIVEVTTSVKTKINIIGQVGARLVDPKSKTAYFTGLFRYAEEKSAVEEILKARTQTLASAMFSKTDTIRNGSGRLLTGRGSPGRGVGAGRGAGSRANLKSNSSASIEKDISKGILVTSILSEDHTETLTPTQSGFDDVLSALDDLTHSKSIKNHHSSNVSLGPIDEGETTETANSSSYSIADPRTTNDSSSVDSNDKSPPRATKVQSAEDGKIILNKVDSSNTIATRTVDAPIIQIEDRSSTTAKTSLDEDVSSISSMESGRSQRSQSLKGKSFSHMNFSPPSSAEKKMLSSKPITKKYSEAAIRTSSRDESEVTHESLVTSSSVADRTKAIANPLLRKAAPIQAPATPAVGKVHATFPFQPLKSPPSSSASSQNDIPKVGKLNIIYPFATPKGSTATTSTTVNRNSHKITTTKVTYISSSRSLASNSSDNESTGSNNSSKTTNERCSTPSLQLTNPPAQQPALPVLSNYNPEKASAGGAGNFNYDLATRCAMAVKLTKEEFLELEEQQPIRVIDGFEKHTYCELVRRNFTKVYGNLQQTELEKYLIEEDFPLAFQKTAEQFFAQVKWRQVEQKKRALLF